MELKAYLSIVRRRWLLASFTFAATVALTFVFVAQQDPTYEASGTFVVRPRTLDASEAVRAFDTLVRGGEINSTYAHIAGSDFVKARAKERLEPSVSTSGSKVSGGVVTGTNILRITVTGREPEPVLALAVAVGEETVAYVSELNDAFELAPLDPPDLPRRPTAPNEPLIIGTGSILALFLSVLLAVGVEALTGNATREDAQDGSMPSELLDEGALESRFRPELARLGGDRRSFSVGFLTVSLDDAADDPWKAAANVSELEALGVRTMPTLPENAGAAYLGRGVFAVILSRQSTQEAEDLITGWLRMWKEAMSVAEESTGEEVFASPQISTSVLSFEDGRNLSSADLLSLESSA